MMVSFDIRGGGRAAERFIDSLKLWYLAPSLGGVESTVSYPVLSSHIGLSTKQLELLGVSPATVRLSVGIEDAGDLIARSGTGIGPGLRPPRFARHVGQISSRCSTYSGFVDPKFGGSNIAATGGTQEKVVSE